MPRSPPTGRPDAHEGSPSWSSPGMGGGPGGYRPAGGPGYRPGPGGPPSYGAAPSSDFDPSFERGRPFKAKGSRRNIRRRKRGFD
ncbi:MAG: hypothetical protein DMF78_13710 [Acidobacteria bacterium]|nr:MAG: hypothetical protein DMF78_13710 [Acidobacteriota bacterium]